MRREGGSRVSVIVAERSPSPAGLIGPGAVIVVAGPSGAGKDSVMKAARERLDPALPASFIRRIITRPADGDAEDHDSVDAETFRRMSADGAFAIQWEAHGLLYGLPASMDKFVASGGVAVANVSRGVIPQLRRRYAHVVPVVVTASVPVLAERLMRRGRESAEAVGARLRRAVAQDLQIAGAETIVNDGSLEDAAEQFAALILRVCEDVRAERFAIP